MIPDLPVNTPASAPEPAAPASAPAASPAPSLESPRSQNLEQLGAALTAAEQETAPGGPAAPGVQQAPQPFDPQAILDEMKAQEARFQRKLERELGQARKAQGDFTKLPELIQQQLEAREKAQRERAIREQLSPEQRIALMDQEADEAGRRKSIEELVAQQVEARWQAQQAEQEGVRNYALAIEKMAGERMVELEPHIMGILGRVDAALKSTDPETVEQGLQYYDYYQQNMGALLWHADAALRKAGPSAAAPVVAAPVQGQPAAAPVTPADQFRQQRQAAGAQASPQARSSAPNSRPASLNDMAPGTSFLNMDKSKLDKLLTEAEAGTR